MTSVSDSKRDVERFVGDRFISWYNDHHNTRFEFHEHQDAPDLVYRDSDAEVALEVTTAYYDKLHARILWATIRDQTSAVQEWSSCSSLNALLSEGVQSCLDAKVNKDYGPNCILIMYLDSPFPIPRNIAEIVSGASLPERSPFMKIYLTGEFPRDGYQCWPVT